MKKVLALFLVALMLLTVLVSCGPKGGDKDDKKDKETESTTQDVIENNKPGESESTQKPGESEGEDEGEDEESETVYVPDTKDELPEKENYGNANYQILSRTTTAYEFDPEVAGGSGGTTVSKAIADRNAATEDRFNVRITTLQEPGDWGSKATFTERVQREASAGFTEIALVSTHSNYLCQIATSGYALDMNNLDYVNYEKDWWSRALYNDCTINGKCYFMIGDIAYTVYERMEVMYFNQTALDFYCDDVYALVDNHEWTYAKMMEWAKDFSVDDGAGNVSQYGLSLNSHSVKSLLTAMEVELTYVDQNDRHQLYAKDELPALVDSKINTLISDIVNTPGIRWYKEGTSTDEKFSTPAFIEGNMLFYGAELRIAKDIAGNIQDEWGILPMPLYDNGQEAYHTGGRDEMSGVMVLKNCSKPSMVGVVTEALALYSHEYVRPAYYETVLKGQLASNSETVEMLDLIRANYKIPFGLAYTTVIGNPYWQIEDCYDASGTVEFSTKYYEMLPTYQANLEAMYNTIDGKK